MKLFDKFFSSDYYPPVKITPENYPIDIYKKNDDKITVTVEVQRLGVENKNARIYDVNLSPEEMEAISKATFASIEEQFANLFEQGVDLNKII